MIHFPYFRNLQETSLRAIVALMPFALGVLLGFSSPLMAAGSDTALEDDFALFEEQLSIGSQTERLCAWERDLGFFLSKERKKSDQSSKTVECSDRLKAIAEQSDFGEMKTEFTSEKEQLKRELDTLVANFPIAHMTQAIAEYDREIAGLIVGIGKKESNWGKRTPKSAEGEECFNYWGYRGTGDRGFTPDGYGCWTKPEAAVKTIGDRLAKLREIRESAEPSRMIVWKCGNSCAGHSDESVRKWIADVNFYFREIAER